MIGSYLDGHFSDMPRVSILDRWDGPGLNDDRDAPVSGETSKLDANALFLKGILIREILEYDDAGGPGISPHAISVGGTHSEGILRLQEPQRNAALTQGIGTTGINIVKVFPETTQEQGNPDSLTNGVGAAVQHIDSQLGTDGFDTSDLLGMVKKGWIAHARAGEFAIWPDNAHFYNSEADYQIPSILKAVSVQANYLSGRHESRYDELDPNLKKRYGARVAKYRGVEVNTHLQADYTLPATEANTGTHDRIDDYIGVNVVAPIKLIAKDDPDPQLRADNAIGKDASMPPIGIKINAPFPPAQDTSKEPTWCSPSDYIGLQANAKSNFDAPVNFSAKAPADFDAAITAEGITAAGTISAQTVSATGNISAGGQISGNTGWISDLSVGTFQSDNNITVLGQITALNQIVGEYFRSTGVSGSPATLTNGDFWYNSAQNDFRTKTPVGTLSLVGTLFTLTQDGVVQGLAANPNFPMSGVGSRAIPPNSLKIGKTIRVNAGGRWDHEGGPITLKFQLKFGSTVVLETPFVPIDSIAGAPSAWRLCGDVTCRQIGATG